jgi:hypothetical protein
LSEAYFDAERADIDGRYGLHTRCAQCVYWLPGASFPGGLSGEQMLIDDPDNGNMDSWGECRRHAPSPSQYLFSQIAKLVGAAAWATEETATIEHEKDADYRIEGVDSHEVWTWPLTKPQAWCGEGRAGRVPMSAETRANLKALRDKEWP